MRYDGYEKAKNELLKKQPGHVASDLYFLLKLPAMIRLLMFYWIDLFFEYVCKRFTR